MRGIGSTKAVGMCVKAALIFPNTGSRDHVKTVTRHIWVPYMEMCEDIRHSTGMNELYALRINHREIVWNSKRESWLPVYADDREGPEGDEAGLMFACMNLKKLAKWLKKQKNSRQNDG